MGRSADTPWVRRALYLIPGVMLAAAFLVAGRSVPSLAVAPGSNGFIAFESNRDGGGDLELWRVQPDGTSLLKLTSNDVADRDPAWSPDGTKVAFIRDGCGGTCRNLWVMNANGTGQTQLTDEPSNVADANPAWSPDGSTIAFAHPTDDGSGQFFKQIWIVPATGGSPTRLTSSAYANWAPDWSPDGTELVFVSTRDGDAAIWTMNADGSAQVKVTLSGAGTPPAFLLGGPSWSPDGTTLAFHGSGNATTEAPRLVLANVDGSQTRTLFDPAGEVYPPSWSPNANKLVVSVNTATGATPNMQLYIVNASTGVASALVPSSFTEQNPSWQPTSAPSPTPSPTVSSSVSASASISASASASPSASPTSTPPPPPPDGIHVAVSDSGFTPATVDLPRGGTLIFDPMGPSLHTATDATGMLLYDSGPADGTSAPTWYTFEAAGIYPFRCEIHASIAGRARVPIGAAPATGPLGKMRTVTWATGTAPAGFVFDVQIRRPGKGWASWKKDATFPWARFLADGGKGTYRFRARLHETGVAASRWSRPASIRVG